MMIPGTCHFGWPYRGEGNLDQLLVDVAIAKSEKYASRESGDTVELVERPSGGFSVVMIDGQGSGRAAKTLSLLLSSKAVALLKEGVRDGVVARATHDYLFAFRHGQVSATLDMLSIDLKTRSVVVTRNAEAPMLLRDANGCQVVTISSAPIGLYQWTKPTVREFPIQSGLKILLFTDGVAHSGLRRGAAPLDFMEFAERILTDDSSSQEMANRVLAHAVERDSGRPTDDIAVVALSIQDANDVAMVRRMQAQIPLA
jgi:serine phosphatase RsbU (regulator of sigma subunit)